MIKHLSLTGLFTVLISFGSLQAQNNRQIIDRIAAVVGDEIVLQSEVIKNMQNVPGGDSLSTEEKKCRTLAKTIQKKLLLTKAKADSVNVKSSRVEAELNRRIQFFVQQIGSRQKLEEYYDRSIPEIRENFRQPVQELLRTQRMKQKLLKDVAVSPKEVKEYFHSMPQDSIPYFNTQVKLAQIVRKPKPTDQQREKAQKRLRELRKRIVEEGESFDNLAILYSDDERTATKGGDLGMKKQSAFNKRFSAAAMQLEKGEISPVIETDDGFHIIKLLERKGEKIHVKHILKKPKVNRKSKQQTRQFLDSVKQLVLNDTFTFAQAAVEFSEDKQTRQNGGLITNQKTGATKLPVEQLNSKMFFNADTMEVGSISNPLPMGQGNKTEGFRIIQIKEKTPPHRANLEQDYPRLKRMALEDAKQQKLEDWYTDYADKTYLKIKSSATNCKAIRKYLENQ